MIIKSNSVEVMFRNETILINKDQFDFLALFRKTRIARQEFFCRWEDGECVDLDSLAQKGELLVPGGEVTGVELSIIFSPMSPDAEEMAQTFGENWFSTY